MAWNDMSDKEIRAHVSRICGTSRSDREVLDRIRLELGCPNVVSLITTVCGPARLTCVMVRGPRGNFLTI